MIDQCFVVCMQARFGASDIKTYFSNIVGPVRPEVLVKSPVHETMLSHWLSLSS